MAAGLAKRRVAQLERPDWVATRRNRSDTGGVVL